MNATILDPLALWGIQGMTNHQAQALIATAPELLAELKKAHRVIALAISLLTPSEITELDQMTTSSNLHGLYMRSVARRTVISMAEGRGRES